MAHVLLKPGLENFEHYFTSVWDKCNCAVVWAFFGIAFLWDWNENWPFPVLWPLLSFSNLLAYWVQHFHSIIFQDLNFGAPKNKVWHCFHCFPIYFTWSDANGGDRIPVELFQTWKMMLWKSCTQYASKFEKLSSGHRTGRDQFSLQSQRKAMPKSAQTTAQLRSSHTLVK